MKFSSFTRSDADQTRENMGLNEFVARYSEPPRILVVEDDPSAAQCVLILLGKFSCAPVHAALGRDAVRAMEREQFDLIIADLMLPDLSYYDLAREIARLQPVAPVVVVSGLIDERAVTALNAVLDRPIWYVEKPFVFDVARARRMFEVLKIRAPLKSEILTREQAS